MTKQELISKIINEATTTQTKGTDEIGDQGAYNTSVFGEIVRRENLYHYVDEYLGYGIKDKGGTDGPEMSNYNRVHRFNQGEKIQENDDKNKLIQDLHNFAVDNDYIMDDLINIFNEAIAANQPQEKIIHTLKNYVDHIIFLYDKFHIDEINNDIKEGLANKLFDAVKHEIGITEATSVGGALGGVDQGMYSQPAIFAKDRKNWRNKDATYEGGEVIQRKNITNVVSNLNENMKYAGIKQLLEYIMNEKDLQKKIKNFIDECLKTDKDSETIFNEIKKYLSKLFNKQFKNFTLEKQHKFTELTIQFIKSQEKTGDLKENLKEKTLKEFTNAEGGNRYKVWDDAETVKIKRKCQDFPYCSEGAADDPIETEKMEEKIQKVAEQTNKSTQKVRKIIRENSQSDCIQKFEEKLFGEFEKWYGDEVEKNTEYETNVFEMLKKFLRGSFVSTSKEEVVDVFRDLLNCKNKYDDILQPDNLHNIRRGEALDLKKLTNENWELVNDQSSDIVYKTTMVYEPRDTIQSWTIESTTANFFAKSRAGKRPIEYPVELKAIDVDKSELLFDPKFLNELHFDENEVIRVSDRPIKCEALLFVNRNNTRHYFYDNQRDTNIIESLKEIDPEIEKRLSYV